MALSEPVSLKSRNQLFDALRHPRALGSAVICLLAAAFIVQLHLSSAPPPIDVGSFALLCGLGALAGPLLAFAPGWTLAPGHWPLDVGSTALHRARYALAGAALLCAFAAALLVHANASGTVAILAWVAGLSLVLAAAWDEQVATALRSLRLWASEANRPRVVFALILLSIMIIGADLRLPELTTIPGYIHNDEASNGLTARAVADGQYSTLFTYGWASLPLLGYSWDALFFKVLGDNLLALRLSSAVLGIAAIAVLGLLGRELFTPRAGLIAAALLAVLHPAIHFSRVGHHYIQALFWATLTIYLLVLALRYGTRLAAVGAGIALSVDLQVYYAARVAYVIVPVAIAYVLLVSDRRLLRPRLGTLGWLAAGWLVGVAPIGAYILSDWSGFNERTREVLVLGGTPDATAHVYSVYGTHNAFTILRTQLWRVIQTFNYTGDSSVQYGSSHPMLDPLTGALFPAAIAFAVCRARYAGYAICLIALAAILVVGGVSTIDPAFWPRLVVILPILALLVAAFLDALWQVVDRIQPAIPLGWLGAAGLAAAIAYGNYYWYFNEFQPTIRNDYVAAPMDIGTFLRPIQDNPSVYGITDGSLYLNHQAIQLLAPQIETCDIVQGLSISQCPFPRRADTIFVIVPGRTGDLARLQATYPGGQLSILHTYDGTANVYVYRIQRS